MGLSMAALPTEARLRREAFVTGHNGTGIFETVCVTSVIPVSPMFTITFCKIYYDNSFPLQISLLLHRVFLSFMALRGYAPSKVRNDWTCVEPSVVTFAHNT